MKHLLYFNESHDFMDEQHRLDDVRDILLSLQSFMKVIQEVVRKKMYGNDPYSDYNKLLDVISEIINHISIETDTMLNQLITKTTFEYVCFQILKWISTTITDDGELTEEFKSKFINTINNTSSTDEVEVFLKLWDVLRGISNSETPDNIDDLKEFIQENIVEEFDRPMKIDEIKAIYIPNRYYKGGNHKMDKYDLHPNKRGGHRLKLIYQVILKYKYTNDDRDMTIVSDHIMSYSEEITYIGFEFDGGVSFGAISGNRSCNFYIRSNKDSK